MTTFDTLVSGAETGRPLDVYKFVIGSRLYTFTDNGISLVLDTDEYRAITIFRGPVGMGGENRKRVLAVQMPASEEFPRQWLPGAPGERTSVTIFELQRDEVPTFNTRRLTFKGTVDDVEFSDDGTTASVLCRSIEAGAARVIPRYNFSGLCNHVLYGDGCLVTPQLTGSRKNRYMGTCTSALVNVVTVAGLGGAFANDFMTGGFVKPVGVNDFRLIVKHTGNDLILNMPFYTSPTGGTLDVYAGCNHDYATDCSTSKFDNRRRYGGFPFVPTKNPYVTGID